MSKLGSLHGTVTVRLDGIDGEGVATFSVPIAVQSQVRQGDVLALSIGTPEGAIRDGVRVALGEALDLVLVNLPDGSLRSVVGGVVAPAAGPLVVDPTPEQYIPVSAPSRRSESIWAETARRLGTEGVGGSNP